jgi:hypothetical protein
MRAAWLPPAPPCPVNLLTIDVRTKCLRHRLHASSYRLLPRFALRPCVHAHTVQARSCTARCARVILSISLRARAYKRRPPHSLSSKPSASCLLLVNCHHRASPLLPPHCQCQATSPLLSPRALVLELQQSPELLPDLKDRHLHRN